MTRKDYVKVAEAIRPQVDAAQADDNFGKAAQALYSVVNSLAIAFADDNPRFDMNRFFRACGFHS